MGPKNMANEKGESSGMLQESQSLSTTEAPLHPHPHPPRPHPEMEEYVMNLPLYSLFTIKKYPHVAFSIITLQQLTTFEINIYLVLLIQLVLLFSWYVSNTTEKRVQFVQLLVDQLSNFRRDPIFTIRLNDALNIKKINGANNFKITPFHYQQIILQCGDFFYCSI